MRAEGIARGKHVVVSNFSCAHFEHKRGLLFVKSGAILKEKVTKYNTNSPLESSNFPKGLRLRDAPSITRLICVKSTARCLSQKGYDVSSIVAFLSCTLKREYDIG